MRRRPSAPRMGTPTTRCWQPTSRQGSPDLGPVVPGTGRRQPLCPHSLDSLGLRQPAAARHPETRRRLVPRLAPRFAQGSHEGAIEAGKGQKTIMYLKGQRKQVLRVGTHLIFNSSEAGEAVIRIKSTGCTRFLPAGKEFDEQRRHDHCKAVRESATLKRDEQGGEPDPDFARVSPPAGTTPPASPSPTRRKSRRPRPPASRSTPGSSVGADARSAQDVLPRSVLAPLAVSQRLLTVVDDPVGRGLVLDARFGQKRFCCRTEWSRSCAFRWQNQARVPLSANPRRLLRLRWGDASLPPLAAMRR